MSRINYEALCPDCKLKVRVTPGFSKIQPRQFLRHNKPGTFEVCARSWTDLPNNTEITTRRQRGS